MEGPASRTLSNSQAKSTLIQILSTAPLILTYVVVVVVVV